MQVSNNYINNAHVQRTTNASGVKPFIPSTPFKQALYTSAPKKTSAPSGYINVTDFYSPKLLLSTYAKKDFIEKFIKISIRNVKKLIENFIKMLAKRKIKF